MNINRKYTVPILMLGLVLACFGCGGLGGLAVDGALIVDGGIDGGGDGGSDASTPGPDACSPDLDGSTPSADASDGGAVNWAYCPSGRWVDGGADSGADAGHICNDCRPSEPIDVPCPDLSTVCDVEYALYSKIFKYNTPTAAIKKITDEDFYLWKVAFVQYGQGIPAASCEAYDAFVSLIDTGKLYTLETKFSVCFPYTLMTSEEQENIISEKGWPYFRDNYGCFYAFTRAGFNKAQDEAVLIRSRQCDSLSGSSELVVFKKLNGVWTEIAVIILGIS